MGTQLTGTLSYDGNGNPVPHDNTELYADANSEVLVVTNASLTSNVATLTFTPGVRLPFTGQSVVIAGISAIYNGTFTVTGISATTITYAKTHADDSTGAVAGTMTIAPTTSPISAGADEVPLVVPANATELEVYCSAVFTLRKVAGGATLGTWSLQATTIIKIAVQPGDTIYIMRTNSGTLNFRFKALK